VRNLLLFAIAVLWLFSCKKEKFTTSHTALLRTDVDTVHFDTVFTTTGSVSQVFKIRNENAKGIRISNVQLAGGVQSPFRINVDGIQGPEIHDIDVAANDSAYVFITVRIDPTSGQLPFIIRDSIAIQYNDRTQWVQLAAYGQNAHFLKDKIVTVNEVWTNDLPYVILGKILVQPNATLTIREGCKIFMHADAPFIVAGTLKVNGDRFDSTRVTFSGDRLDAPYRDFPASFPGLIFTETSVGNVLNYAVIKNAYQGVVAIDPSPGTKLTLNETIIDNAYDVGVLGVNTSISARNLLVSNCGKNILLVLGGDYDFVHCTSASYSNYFLQHKDPVFQISNFLKQNNTIMTADLNASFRNCIFWGESGGLVKNEVVIAREGNTLFNVHFDNVLWPVSDNPENVTSVTGANIRGEDPQFENITSGDGPYNFRLKESSPALNKGGMAGVSSDLDGNPRPAGLPDLGAYEKQ
jgi:hypothetical protein